MGIRKQVLYLLLSCSIITLFVAEGIALYGMINIKSNAVDIGIKIGETAAENSSKALKEVSIASLQGLVHERSKQVNYIFNEYIWDVTTLSKEMTTILQNPQNYSSRRTAEPDRANAGKITPQLLYVEGVNREDVAYEVGLTGNLQDFMIRLNDGNESIASTFVVSANGFSITVDKVSDTSVDEK